MTIIGSGFAESIGQVAVLAGSVVLLLMVIAVVGAGYRHLQGDGIEWPDESEGDGGVTRGGSDDEWKYY